MFLSKADHLDLLSLVTDWLSSTSKHGVTTVSTGEQRTSGRGLPILGHCTLYRGQLLGTIHIVIGELNALFDNIWNTDNDL